MLSESPRIDLASILEVGNEDDAGLDGGTACQQRENEDLYGLQPARRRLQEACGAEPDGDKAEN